MKMIHAKPMTGNEARMTKPIVHLRLMAMAAPHTNMAKRLNMLPIFSPVAFC